MPLRSFATGIMPLLAQLQRQNYYGPIQASQNIGQGLGSGLDSLAAALRRASEMKFGAEQARLGREFSAGEAEKGRAATLERMLMANRLGQQRDDTAFQRSLLQPLFPEDLSGIDEQRAIEAQYGLTGPTATGLNLGPETPSPAALQGLSIDEQIKRGLRPPTFSERIARTREERLRKADVTDAELKKTRLEIAKEQAKTARMESERKAKADADRAKRDAAKTEREKKQLAINQALADNLINARDDKQRNVAAEAIRKRIRSRNLAIRQHNEGITRLYAKADAVLGLPEGARQRIRELRSMIEFEETQIDSLESELDKFNLREALPGPVATTVQALLSHPRAGEATVEQIAAAVAKAITETNNADAVNWLRRNGLKELEAQVRRARRARTR